MDYPLLLHHRGDRLLHLLPDCFEQPCFHLGKTTLYHGLQAIHIVAARTTVRFWQEFISIGRNIVFAVNYHPSDPFTLWPTVRRIFDLLNEVPEKERDTVIRRECTDLEGALDEALYAEVRALLEADAASQADGFLGQAAANHAAHLLAEIAPDAAGERVGPWQVTGLLGEGGMGVVYRARRADGAYEQEAALKVIGRGLAPPSLVEEAMIEAKV